MNITPVGQNQIRQSQNRQNPNFGARVVTPEVRSFISCFIPEFGTKHCSVSFADKKGGFNLSLFTRATRKIRGLAKQYPNVVYSISEFRKVLEVEDKVKPAMFEVISEEAKHKPPLGIAEARKVLSSYEPQLSAKQAEIDLASKDACLKGQREQELSDLRAKIYEELGLM